MVRSSRPSSIRIRVNRSTARGVVDRKERYLKEAEAAVQ
jgi:hypothetical protein